MRTTLVETKISVVLIGNFNPRIFQPSWFAKTGVIGDEESENADIEIIHNEIVKFQIDWVKIHIERNRFIAELKQPPNIRLYDFILKTFRELLLHTPIWMLGINMQVTADTGSIENRDKIGKALAPPEAWGEWSNDIQKQTDDTHGGMQSLSMRQNVLDDRERGYIQAKIEPSKTIRSGVYIETNDHYESLEGENVEGCQEIMSIFENRFDDSLKRSEWIIKQVTEAE